MFLSSIVIILIIVVSGSIGRYLYIKKHRYISMYRCDRCDFIFKHYSAVCPSCSYRYPLHQGTSVSIIPVVTIQRVPTLFGNPYKLVDKYNESVGLGKKVKKYMVYTHELEKFINSKMCKCSDHTCDSCVYVNTLREQYEF